MDMMDILQVIKEKQDGLINVDLGLSELNRFVISKQMSF